eukprot:TRINITY_DN10880_c0_g3_i1.p1 TRINITY_DN10880_c0_g3~~TRINITY_DN10880_c0_g3_i1.p1  ORF type:complete len:306 (-),score=56.08 TRINITY_DN10880_c0_g3_i1:800-1669(-)
MAEISNQAFVDPLSVLDDPLDWADCLRKTDPQEADVLLGMVQALRHPSFREALRQWVLSHCEEFRGRGDENCEHQLQWTILHKEFVALFESCVEDYMAASDLPQEDLVMIATGWKGQTICPEGNCSDTCTLGHPLKDCVQEELDYACDRCEGDIAQGETVKRCKICDYDLCFRCQSKLTSRSEQLAIERLLQIMSAPACYESFVVMMRRASGDTVKGSGDVDCANNLGWGVMQSDFSGSAEYGEGYLDVREGDSVYLDSVDANGWARGKVYVGDVVNEGLVPLSYWKAS